MKNLLGILYGAVFGVANVIPGVSGGTMLVAFGCYDKVCGATKIWTIFRAETVPF